MFTSNNSIVSATLYPDPLAMRFMAVTPPVDTSTLNVAPVPSLLLNPVTVYLPTTLSVSVALLSVNVNSPPVHFLILDLPVLLYFPIFALEPIYVIQQY